MFLLGAAAYGFTAFISYHDTIKAHWTYFPLGLFLSVLANFGWLKIAKVTESKNDIVVYGAFWDSMIVMVFLMIPLLWFGVRLTTKDSIGLALIISGILVMKLIK